MDCDQVFNTLTRGPFPSGNPDDALVEEHLETCIECWRLAEALRPADDIFQEAVPPAESRNLPGYWGDTTPPSVVMARISQRAARSATATAIRQTAVPLAPPASQERVAKWSDLVTVLGIVLPVIAATVGVYLLLTP